ncbi:MAG: hypothetical protein JW965_00765 [Bacteroidales bacterium]|nr:hypothetical protein [Bacteroidales bacterium]
MRKLPFGSGLIKNLSNLPGWRTKRKLVVLESDDWGSIRMPSRQAFERLLIEGIDLISDEGSRFNKYDSLATSRDLELLFEVLSSVKDSCGNPSVLTPVSVVANPDFEKIRQSEFTEYHYEPFTETLKRYKGCDESFKLWREGIENRIFLPQFHGREHLNVKVWMRALMGRHENTTKAFNQNMWGISTTNDPDIKMEFQAAFDFIDPGDLEYHEEVISSGLNLFESLFGYRATYLVPPNGPMSSKLDKVCYDEGIRFISVPKLQIEPLDYGRTRKKIHWLGQKNKHGLRYITRNCFFEPGESGRDWVDSCMNEISEMFGYKKPAIISSHRLNYIGALYPENRDNGLKQLNTLLRQIIKTWPDAEFITTAQLGEIINNE